jgi:hypothetical protein
MSEFKSIEEMFPEWKEARQVIEKNIPTKITFKIDDVNKNMVTLNQDFIQAISNSYWDYRQKALAANDLSDDFKSYSVRILNKKGEINNYLVVFFTELESDFKQLLCRPTDRMTLELFADIWNRNDERRKIQRLKTSLDVINHCFGIRPLHPPIIKIKISFVV